MYRIFIISLALSMSCTKQNLDGSNLESGATPARFSEDVTPYASAAVPGGGSLQFEDEFDDATFKDDWLLRDNDKLGGVSDPDMVEQTNGSLNIDFKYDKGLTDPTIRYRSGGVVSTHTFGYGYYEARCKLYTKSKGLHQSFWSMGLTGTNEGEGANVRKELVSKDLLPDYNQVLEIDGFEQNSVDGVLAVNYHSYTPKQRQFGGNKVANPGSNEFTMGYLWTPGQLNFYYNGQLVDTKMLKDDYKVYAPQNVWLTALPVTSIWGGAEAPNPDAKMQVSSFRYYAKPLPGVNLTGNSSFEYKDKNDNSGRYPIGWITTKLEGYSPDQIYVKTGATLAKEGSRYLVHETAPTPYLCTTKQRLEYLPKGKYKLGAFVKSGGGQKIARMRILQGSDEKYVDIPATKEWKYIEIDNINVYSKTVVIAFTTETSGPNQWICVDNVNFFAK